MYFLILNFVKRFLRLQSVVRARPECFHKVAKLRAMAFAGSARASLDQLAPVLEQVCFQRPEPFHSCQQSLVTALQVSVEHESNTALQASEHFYTFAARSIAI